MNLLSVAMKLPAIMKKLGWILFLISIGCSNELRVYSDYDRDFDVSQYKTYSWAAKKEIENRNNPLYYNELTDKRIKAAVNEQLRSRGITETEKNPDAILHYHIAIEDRSMVSTDPYGLYGPYWTHPANIIAYREGTLIIDIMDGKTNNLAWRGWAVSIINENETERREEILKKAVKKIFETLPGSH